MTILHWLLFGLGRYLYQLPSGWADYDPKTRQFTDKAKVKLTGILVQHYRRAAEGNSEPADIYAADTEQHDPAAATLIDTFDALGEELYGADNWPAVRERNTKRVSGDRTPHFDELKAEELQKLIDGMTTLKNKRQPEASLANADPIPH